MKIEIKLSKLGLAISIASKVFEDTTDKGGNPYILHCLRQKDFDRL